VSALIMLAGIYYGAQYGGSTTAILVNLPGETSAVVTCIDGYQMARQGRAGPALAIAAIGSFFAGTVGTLLIAVAGPPLAEVALKFGSAEYFSLMLMGLVAAAVLAQGDMVKSLAMVVLGLLLGIVGTDVNTGVQRFSFGVPELSDGIGFIVVAVGVFAIGEIINNLGDTEKRNVFTAKVKNLFPSKDDFKRSIGPILRGTGIGAFFGVLPGTGPAIASFASYMVEKKISDDPSRFGNGAMQVHPHAHARIAGQRRDGADAGCDADPGHPAGAAGDDAAAGSVLGPYCQHVDRQPDAGRAERAADRALGEAPAGAVSPLVPRYHGVLGDRHFQRQQLVVRDLPDGSLRHFRLHLRQARLSGGAAAAGLRAGADDGGEPAPRAAAVAR
jgi:hypothetical protein